MNAQDDEVRLRHMLGAAREARAFVHGRTREDLDTDRVLVRALVAAITVIGEAASRISKPFQETTPEIPWADIIGMRNRLVHAYFNIDLDRIWDVVQDDLSSLIPELEKLVPPEEDSEDA